MSTDPSTHCAPSSPVSTGATPAPSPLPTVTATDNAAKASFPMRPVRPSRADWVRIAIFGIPYATFFLLGIVPTSIIPESWNVTAVNVVLDSIFLVMVLAFFGREFFRAFSYFRTRPVLKIALLFGMWFLLTIVQATLRISIYGTNPPIAQNQQAVMNALSEGALSIVFSFFVAIGVPMIEEIFYRHILIGKLSAFAPTWLVASISAILFAYMHCYQWQDLLAYLPISIALTLIYVKSGKNIAYSWAFHALNNSIMVGLIFLLQSIGITP